MEEGQAIVGGAAVGLVRGMAGGRGAGASLAADGDYQSSDQGDGAGRGRGAGAAGPGAAAAGLVPPRGRAVRTAINRTLQGLGLRPIPHARAER